MNNLSLGQYIEKNSIIHHLDPRTKLLGTILLMIIVFLIPNPLSVSNPLNSFIGLGVLLLLVLLVVILSKVSLLKYLKSIKQVLFIIVFAFIVQLFTPNASSNTVDVVLNLSWINILISVLLLILFFLVRKHLPIKMLIFLGVLVLIGYLLTLDFGVTFKSPIIKIYESGLYNGSFFALRILIVIMLSTAMTLTTKPTAITQAIEWLLHPLTYLKLNVSVFAMMISLALRYIPTIFNETQKILKAQSSRGVDFKEGGLKQQISQIVALLIPIMVIAYKRSEDLAFAMQARSYIPGDKRTNINVLKFRGSDIFSFIVILLILSLVIVWKCLCK